LTTIRERLENPARLRGAQADCYADDGSAARKPPADQALAVLTARKPLSGGELRLTEGTQREKTHRQGLDPMPDDAGIGGIREMLG
jgi:hypothetical protein